MARDSSATTTAPRCGLMHTHLPLFLTESGERSDDPAFARALASYLTGIVVVATQRAAGKRSGKAMCASHAVAGGCSGEIEMAIEEKPHCLEWWCPVCGYDGSITGWEGTRWDRRTPRTRPANRRRVPGAGRV